MPKKSQKSEQKRFTDIARQASGVPVIKLVQTIIDGAVNSGATDIHLDPQEPEMRVRYRIDGLLHDIMSISPDMLTIMRGLFITIFYRPSIRNMADTFISLLPVRGTTGCILRQTRQCGVVSGAGWKTMESITSSSTPIMKIHFS